ncbi:MAG: hypothetical protein M3Q72_02755, partial [Actinomycetota bacterium]|nr:hypothetical protein [Actinomycetota bacterium]
AAADRLHAALAPHHDARHARALLGVERERDGAGLAGGSRVVPTPAESPCANATSSSRSGRGIR